MQAKTVLDGHYDTIPAVLDAVFGSTGQCSSEFCWANIPWHSTACYLWCCSLRHHYFCTKQIYGSKVILFSSPMIIHVPRSDRIPFPTMSHLVVAPFALKHIPTKTGWYIYISNVTHVLSQCHLKAAQMPSMVLWLTFSQNPFQAR